MPEVAARAHLRWIVPVLDQALATPASRVDDVDAVAVTHGPGLAGSLLVGLNFAKTLAWVHDKPLVGVNHLEGHLYAAWLRDLGPQAAQPEEPVFPLVALIVSGGHTFLVEMPDHLTYRLLGQTVDDAAGEAFDKVGRLLGLSYPGGPAISRAAEAATRHDAAFPRAWLGDSYDFSFSGLKTAARRTIDEARAGEGLPTGRDAARRARRPPLGAPRPPSSRGASRTRSSTCSSRRRSARPWRPGARSIVLGGGVAANGALRTRLAGEAEARGLPLIVPRPALCTDNGAMIGAAGRPAVRGRRAGRPVARRAAVPPARASRVRRGALRRSWRRARPTSTRRGSAGR